MAGFSDCLKKGTKPLLLRSGFPNRESTFPNRASKVSKREDRSHAYSRSTRGGRRRRPSDRRRGQGRPRRQESQPPGGLSRQDRPQVPGPSGEVMARRVLNFLYNLDRAFASLGGAPPQETISSEVGLNANSNWLAKQD